MSNVAAMRIAFLCLQLSCDILLTLLLATQYFYRIKRHPVVSALLVCDIIRSIVGAIPGLLWHSLEQQSTGSMSGALARICVIDALLYNYLMSVRLAFDVSLSFCIFLMVRRVDSPETASLEISRSLGIMIAVIPYIWALPVFIIAVPYLFQSGALNAPGVSDGFPCVLSFLPLFALTGFVSWVPLGLSLIFSFAVFFHFLRFYYRHRNILVSRHNPNFALLLRLGALAVLSISTAVFLSFINASTAQNRVHLAQICIFGLTLSTFLEFFILTQSQVLRIWKGWAYKLIGRPVPPTTQQVLPPSFGMEHATYHGDSVSENIYNLGYTGQILEKCESDVYAQAWSASSLPTVVELEPVVEPPPLSTFFAKLHWLVAPESN